MREATRGLLIDVFYGIGVMTTIILVAFFISVIYDEYAASPITTTSLQCKG
jgi:hypothetical protein